MLFASSSGAMAEQIVMSPDVRPKAVVEMFTSQGCGFCPPADQHLADLARAGEVVALAYHIDYWDYLGWHDTMANAGNTARQQEYSRAFGNRSVYTPQAIINGRQQMNGAERSKVEGAIARMAGTADGLSVDLNVSYQDGVMVIEADAAGHPVKDARLVVVYFEPVTPVKIVHGKNAGRDMVYWNAVTSFHTAGIWHGDKARIELPAAETAGRKTGGCAVLLQEIGKGNLPGAIIGATIVNRPVK